MATNPSSSNIHRLPENTQKHRDYCVFGPRAYVGFQRQPPILRGNSRGNWNDANTVTPGLLAASRAFAREQFAFQHRYALVLHTDQDHPHVHLVVKAMSERGERLNIRKATWREWRNEFARHLREQGIAANTTERAVRGESKTHKRDGIYRAMRRGNSTHLRARAEAVARELSKGSISIEPGKATLLKTREEIEQGWQAVGHLLASQGLHSLATQVNRFIEQFPSAKTERERLAEQLLDHVRTRARHRTAIERTR